ncbi:hypothetical protein P0082_11685 [Candidatus Haliotispira prima]|uniref:Glutamate--cysteine ligase n=1 Tax=Candidatus Haliotispira prima TaxID=3034016 RepID=A0ABY8MGN4_9SPIO|nr:hypothetical protein P0082_11685 [Candidatus Haliotispira prima]
MTDKAALWRGGLHGFERETFRLDASTGSPGAAGHAQLFGQEGRQTELQTERFLGSEGEKARLRELLPNALTLDFSDQQIELVSPPHPDIAEAEADIALLLRFVAGELQQQNSGEVLWACSQPPLFSPQDLSAIRIADFGDDPNAEYKEKYREQLVLRYGKAKQSWTGVHYNFSLDPHLFDDLKNSPCETYLHMARNLWRNFWLLELLFGCTPSLSPFYIEQIREHFAGGGVSLAPPPGQAGSLHSHFGYGYRSFEQQMQNLDYSHPCAYWQSVERIAQTESRFFRRLRRNHGPGNINLIQDSRELYTPFRLKQLHAHGNECWEKDSCLVDYLELRILDIDPIFDRQHYSGIHLPSVYLAHLLFLHSTLIDSPMLGPKELRKCARREQYIVSQGRNLRTLPPEFRQQAGILLEELGELANLLGFPQAYTSVPEDSLKALETGRFRVTEVLETLESEQAPLLRHSTAWTEFLQNAANKPN